MFKPTALVVPLLTLFLAACGGSDGGSVTGSNTTDGNSSGGDSSGGDSSGGDSSGGDSGDNAIPASLQVGSGQGIAFEPGVLLLSGAGDGSTAIDVTVSVTDKNNASAEVSGNYRTVFASNCLTPVNGTESITQGASTIQKRFKNDDSCTTDAISATVYPYGNTTAIGVATATYNRTTTTVDVVDPALGSGSGATFREGLINTESYAVVAGASIELSITAVDKNNSNSTLSSSYQYTFSSVCSGQGEATFTIPATSSNSGQVTTSYQNINCAAGDTITARLFAADADTSVIGDALATATLSIDTALPKLGNGSGADFADGEIAGRSILSGSDSVELTATVVNPLDNNAAIDGADYLVSWSTSCADGKFSLQQQSLADDIRTRYSSDITNCLGTDTITLSLTERSNTGVELASATKAITVELGVAPKIGSGSAATFNQGTLVISPATLSAGGTALVGVSVVDGNNSDNLVENKAYGVVLTSSCFEEIPPLVKFSEQEKIISQGQARFSYEATGCVGTDTVTASLYNVVDGAIDRSNALATANGNITVSKAEIGAISFSAVSSQTLSIQGIGNDLLPAQATVSFKVIDKNGEPVANQPVEFSLSSNLGGIELPATSGQTNAEGIASAVVTAGSTHAVFTVSAKTTTDAGAELRTSSLPISVTTGYPDQDSFDIALNTFNPGAYDINGTSVNVTVFAADLFNNPVPDGTVINFTAESGIIAPSCSTSNGKCSVNWDSSGVRPGSAEASLEKVNEVDAVAGGGVAGMTTILAYTKGESSYTDANANGMFDDGELFVAYPEAFRDDNYDGVHNAGSTTASVEFFADINNDGSYDAAPGKFQGSVCSDTAIAAGHCATAMNVRASTRLVQSAALTAPVIRYFIRDAAASYTEVTSIGYTYASNIIVLLQDVNGNIPASGTSAAFSADGYKLTGDSGVVPNSIGYLNENGDVNGFPVNRGALYQMSVVLEDPAERGPLETNVTYAGGNAGSTLTLRDQPTIKVYYRTDEDGDGTPEDGEAIEEYTGQTLPATSATLWMLINDGSGSEPGIDNFTLSVIGGDVILGAVVDRTPGEISDFPTTSLNRAAIVKEFSVSKNTDTNSSVKATATFLGGETNKTIGVIFP